MTVAHEQTSVLLLLRTLNLGSPRHFIDEEAKAQRGRVTCLKAHSSWAIELGFEPGLMISASALSPCRMPGGVNGRW